MVRAALARELQRDDGDEREAGHRDRGHRGATAVPVLGSQTDQTDFVIPTLMAGLLDLSRHGSAEKFTS